MGPKLARHLRANVVGYLALFVALGGTTYAALKLPANSVGTKQLKNGAVTGAKVAKNTLTGGNINLSSLGTVPSAASAAQANTATSATTATNATQLGGQAPSAFQQRVTGTCSSGSAVSSISQSGQVGCQTANVTQMMGGSLGPVTAGSSYFPPIGLTAPAGSEMAVWLSSSSLAGTAGNLNAETATAVAGPVTVTLHLNGNPTPVSCVIHTGGSICSDSTDTVSIPAGAYVDMTVADAGPTSTRVTFGWTDTS